MSADQLHEYANRTLLTVGGSSYGMWAIFKTGSEFCQVLMPYLSIISFSVYFILNFRKLCELISRPFKKRRQK
jgi:regulator of sigma D